MLIVPPPYKRQPNRHLHFRLHLSPNRLPCRYPRFQRKCSSRRIRQWSRSPHDGTNSSRAYVRAEWVYSPSTDSVKDSRTDAAAGDADTDADDIHSNAASYTDTNVYARNCVETAPYTLSTSNCAHSAPNRTHRSTTIIYANRDSGSPASTYADAVGRGGRRIEPGKRR